MLNKQKFTLKILAILEIVKKLQPCHCDTECNCEATAELPLPLLICKELLQEYKYQTELYFAKVIEPHIKYTYPNEYWLQYVTWKSCVIYNIFS